MTARLHPSLGVRLFCAALVVTSWSASIAAGRQPSATDSPAASPADAAPAVSVPASPPPRVAPTLDSVTPLAHVEVMGKGPIPLVLIPHWTLDWSAWKPFMERNTERYTMYAVTLPGFGGSDPPPLPVAALPSDQLWLDNAAWAVLALIDERKIDKPVIIGSFLGGNVAIRVALKAPEVIRGIISIEGSPALPMTPPGAPPLSEEYRRSMVDQQLRPKLESITDEQWIEVVRAQAMSWTKDPARGARFGDAAVRVPKTIAVTYNCEMLATDLTIELAGMRKPALFLAAIPATPPAAGLPLESIRQGWRDTLASGVNCSLAFFEGSRADIPNDEPEAFDRAVAQFVQGAPVEGKPASAGR